MSIGGGRAGVRLAADGSGAGPVVIGAADGRTYTKAADDTPATPDPPFGEGYRGGRWVG